MALDGIVLHQICKELQCLVPSKINKIQQVSDTEILFNLRTNNKNKKLFISTHSSYNRIHLTNRVFTSPEVPQSFLMVCRKYLQGAILKELTQLGLDRVLLFTWEARDDLGDIHNIYMYVELMGKYANIILVNDQNKVIDALKRIPPFENNIRTIHPGAVFVRVTPQEGKLDPFESDSYSFETSLTKQFHGFSPLLSDEFFYRLKNNENFKDIMNEINNSNSIYACEINDKLYYHMIPLKHLNVDMKQYPIMEGYDTLYFEKEEKLRIKEQSGDLFKIVKQELKKNRNKVKKLYKTLDDAYDLDKYRMYGDLLYAYSYQFKNKEKQVTLPDFETGEDIIIPLDIKYDVKTNAKKYYQKYNKSKTAQIEVAKQIQITEDLITYFENLEVQLEFADFNDALEIREELLNKGYLRNKQKNVRKKKKKDKPHFITLDVDDVHIYIGKNNIQNDYITWKLGRKDYTWFHVKDMHGSHVVIDTKEPSEEILRMASMFAAYYSKGRQSSSVPVNYCLIRNLKKPNNAALGFVVLGNYKTIYIDPEEDTIKQYLSEYEVK